MTADEKVNRLTYLQREIDKLLSSGIEENDPKVVNLQKEFDRIDTLNVSDRVKRDDPDEEIVIV